MMCMSNVKVEIRIGSDEFLALRAEWQALYCQSQSAPFLTWEWAATWYEELHPDSTPAFVCAREDGQLIGLLAFRTEVPRIAGFPVQRLSFLGDGFGGADYLDVLATRGRESEVTAAMFSFLTQHIAFDVLELEGLDETSPVMSWLAQNAPQRLQQRPLYVCPQVDLTVGWETVLQQSRRADNFKRRLRQLRTRAGFAFRTITEPAEAEAAFACFLKLHEARWADAGGSEMTGHARLQCFHRALVRRFAAAGILRFDELWIEGACRASIYGLEHQGRYYFYNSGYDQTWRNASVGLVALGLSIQAAVARGNIAYDFLRGEENYKFDWATTTRRTVTARLTASHPRARAFAAWQQTSDALLAGLRDALPLALLTPLRQARRAWIKKQELSGSPAAFPLTYE